MSNNNDAIRNLLIAILAGIDARGDSPLVEREALVSIAERLVARGESDGGVARWILTAARELRASDWNAFGETLALLGAPDLSDDEPWDGFMSDAEADADALASAGWGCDEDYGCFDEGW